MPTPYPSHSRCLPQPVSQPCSQPATAARDMMCSTTASRQFTSHRDGLYIENISDGRGTGNGCIHAGSELLVGQILRYVIAAPNQGSASSCSCIGPDEIGGCQQAQLASRDDMHGIITVQ